MLCYATKQLIPRLSSLLRMSTIFFAHDAVLIWEVLTWGHTCVYHHLVTQVGLNGLTQMADDLR